jgi:hypothetical protein
MGGTKCRMLNRTTLLHVEDSIWQPDCLDCARRFNFKEAGMLKVFFHCRGGLTQ